MIKSKRLQRIGKQVVVRPMTLNDYTAWKESFLGISKKPKDIYDIIRPKKSNELSRDKFKNILREQDKQIKTDSYYRFGIFLKDGTLVGRVSLMDISRGIFQNAYVGYSLCNQYWGNGYASEAVRLAFDIGFNDLKLHRIEAGIEPRNHRSIRLAKKVGMRKEGLSRKRLLSRGKWRDILLFAITAEEWCIYPVSKNSHSDTA